MEHVLDHTVGGVKIRQRGLSPPSQFGASQSLLKVLVLRWIYIGNFAALALTQGAADQVLKTMLERPQTIRIDAVAE